jgi:hypothetical protein
MTLDHILETMTLNKIVDFDSIVACYFLGCPADIITRDVA